MDLRPDSARVISDDGMREVSPDVVEVGAIIEVRPGERIPLDGEVTQGESAVDTSALTGESVPRSVGIGDTVLSGFVNDSGTIRIRVTKPYKESSVSRILELVEDAAARKAPQKNSFPNSHLSIHRLLSVLLRWSHSCPLVCSGCRFE